GWMAQARIGLGVEQLPGAAGIAVRGLLVERGGVVLNQRLRPVRPLQRERIEAVLDVEDERPAGRDGLLALDAKIGLSKAIRRDRVLRPIAGLLDQRFDPIGIVAVERGAVRLVAGPVIEPPVEPDAAPGERAIVGAAGQKVVEAREARLRPRRRGLSERRLLRWK